MLDFISRLLAEKAELDGRILKLESFVKGHAFNGVAPAQQHLLNVQLSAMLTYSQCLLERLVDLGAVTKSSDGSNPPGGPGTPP
jgi:hypothetical protein